MSSAADALRRLEVVARPNSPEFATVAEAARALGIGTKALRGAVQRGEVSVYQLGTTYRAARSDEYGYANYEVTF